MQTRDFDIVGSIGHPRSKSAIIDPDTVLTKPVSLQPFKSIPCR